MDIHCDRETVKRIRLPMRGTAVEAVLLDGVPVPYTVTPALSNSYITVETSKTGRFQLRVIHKTDALPRVTFTASSLTGSELAFTVCGGEIVEVFDPSASLKDIHVIRNTI